MQSKKQSLIETITNTAVGFAISLASTFIIFPIVGIASTGRINVVVTIFFTAISLLRGYVIRRCFNKPKARHVRYPSEKLFWLHCFECENDMPVVEDKDALYCSNCGLKH